MGVPKKLAVIGFSGLSGATQVGINYVKGIEIPQEDIVFIFHGKTAGVTPSYLDELNALKVETCFVRKKSGLVDLESQIGIYRQLQHYKPENVLVVSASPFIGISAYKLANSKATIVVVEQHPLNLISFKEYVHAYAALAFYDHVVPASRTYADGYIKSMKPLSSIFGKKIRVIPNGLDVPLSSTPATHQEIALNTVTLGMAARFDDVKDYDTVIRALHMLNTTHTGTRYVFKMAGDGPNRARTENLVRELGQESNAEFLGLINKPEMEAFYNSVDIYIQSSKGEAMSFSMMEAMGHGKVFLGTSVRGVEEFIVNGENGLHFRCGDPADLVQKISFIYENPAIAEKLSKGARAYYDKFFSLSAMVREYSSLMSWTKLEGQSKSI
ncbi:glycosyltransferase family 4 protein [Dyadobacter sandarakinus]|uniref:Glycosyltransferase family 4 protein n=1 Tax=Dyadobacter sandarakinus TaxID=2747268 RepID=A0ABX7IBS9_9BACT|nr:glycosyltransferase family 4 protein [Dyadobacter sandarakinus]QRR03389.1 glycosyltransferase family 4 protein [Dyadobacter sandarakinus]